MSKIKLVQGEALETMDRMIKAGIKVDCIIADIPYGTTQNKWDVVIPFEEMWKRLTKLSNPRTPIVLFGSEPFSSLLRCSNLKNYKHDWIWNKILKTGHLNSKKYPMGQHEIISIFGKGGINYHPLMEVGTTPHSKGTNWKKQNSSNYGKESSDFIPLSVPQNYPTTLSINIQKPHYKVSFPSGYSCVSSASHINSGNVLNRLFPTVYGVGYAGLGHSTRKERQVWHDMLRRCYSTEQQEKFPSYIGCSVSKEWHNLTTFCEDIKHIKGYTEWIVSVNSNTQRAWELDKDIKIKGNKVYSKNTCIFVSHKENNKKEHKKVKLTGKTYIGARVSDGYTEEFINQSMFAKKYKLNIHHINSCIHGNLLKHKGWTFKTKEEFNG